MGEKIVYDTIFARSFSRYDQKKLGYGAFVGCLLIVLSFFTFFKPYLGPLPVLNMRLSMDSGLKMLRITDSTASFQQQKANDTSSSLRIIVNDEPSSSSQLQMVVANDISSSSDETKSDDIISSDMALPLLDDSISSNSKTPEINYSLSSNATMTNNKISLNLPLSADNNDDKSSGSEMPGVNTSKSNDATISNLSGPVVNGSSSSSEMLEINDRNSSQQVRNVVQEKVLKSMCDIEGRTEICEMNGDIRVDGKSSTVFMAAASSQAEDGKSWIIRPYARKGDEEALNHATKWSVKPGVVDDGYTVPQCNQNHNVPAIIFSIGGYAGNNFHDYTDIVIPLYLTAREFNGEVKFLVSNRNPWWINKFQHLLRALSNYELIDIDKEANVHCFKTVIVGLRRSSKELSIDPSKPPYYSMKDFREFLRSTYSLKKHIAIKMKDNIGKRIRSAPRLLILARKRTRAFTNTDDIARMARRLGYKVIVAEAISDVDKVAELVNSCDVLMGIHGAGLTNMVFLPENAIVIQILPIGGFEWLAKTDFAVPSKDMNLRYLEYKIKTEESTLIQQFPPEHEAFSNPYAIQKKGWYEFKSIYLDKQNVKLDINRFRPTLLEALQLLSQ